MADKAKTSEQITDAFFERTDAGETTVNIGPAARQVVWDFLNTVADDVTVGEIRTALEEQFS